eukprot:scaffold666842_cov61-Prasinocladus_malaysianus.AAC.1
MKAVSRSAVVLREDPPGWVMCHSLDPWGKAFPDQRAINAVANEKIVQRRITGTAPSPVRR